MPVAQWPIRNDRPVIEIVLADSGGHDFARSLIADSGAGSRQAVFQLVLDENDCLRSGAILIHRVQLGGAYSGWFPVYLVQVRIPQLGFDDPVPAVGVGKVPSGFDGIAGFGFLNRFHYGNFGSPAHFGLDLLRTP